RLCAGSESRCALNSLTCRLRTCSDLIAGHQLLAAGSYLIWAMTYFTNQSVQIRPRSYASCSDLPSPFGRRVGDEGLRQSSEELECLGEMISLPEPNHL